MPLIISTASTGRKTSGKRRGRDGDRAVPAGAIRNDVSIWAAQILELRYVQSYPSALKSIGSDIIRGLPAEMRGRPLNRFAIQRGLDGAGLDDTWVLI